MSCEFYSEIQWTLAYLPCACILILGIFEVFQWYLLQWWLEQHWWCFSSSVKSMFIRSDCHHVMFASLVPLTVLNKKWDERLYLTYVYTKESFDWRPTSVALSLIPPFNQWIKPQIFQQRRLVCQFPNKESLYPRCIGKDKWVSNWTPALAWSTESHLFPVIV